MIPRPHPKNFALAKKRMTEIGEDPSPQVNVVLNQE
jgi:hypothetical protein